MIGVYDFCGHYDWTFEWLRQQGGEPLVRHYWDEAIHQDAQRHASELIRKEGFAGMAAYWGHTLDHEGAGYHTTAGEGVFRIDMQDCPSKGFLLRNGLGAYHDYCDHCMGWIGPMLKQAGFAVDHEHNHRGQCGGNPAFHRPHPAQQARRARWSTRCAAASGLARGGRELGRLSPRQRPGWQGGQK